LLTTISNVFVFKPSSTFGIKFGPTAGSSKSE
jgi:hypothetical protein